jgi:riboflavin synthase
MFTGLVEERGTLAARIESGAPSVGARLRIRCAMGPLALGESISVDGVCLTVVTITPDGFEAEASAETLSRTTLGSVAVAGPVNLERAMQLGGRMGGHMVTGHVDAPGELLEKTSVGTSTKMVFRFPPTLARFIAEKGSITVSGVSLTVNGAFADRFDVVIIPHTAEVTTLGALVPGSRVNLEVDILARYVLRAATITET